MTGPSADASVPASLRYAPHLAVASLGYVVFAYASVPGLVMRRFEIGFVAVGLLMSVVLLSFTLVQLPGGRLVAGRSTSRLLLAALVVHAALAVALDLAGTFLAVLALRAAWGLAGGLILTAGATHIARLYAGAAATRQQGIYGGMITLGGAVSFLVTPPLADATGWFGVHAAGAAVALPAIAVLWRHRNAAPVAPRADPAPDAPSVCDEPTADRRPADSAANGGAGTERREGGGSPWHGTVLLAGFCYVATLSAYVTLSTFVTAYFDDLGVVGPLNVAVLLMATVGRAGGGIAVREWAVADGRTIAVTTAVGAVGFGALAVLSGPLLLILPLVVMLAVCAPFGAIYNVAADAPVPEGTAIAVVVALGNFAALVLPAVTGLIRDVTGGYDAAFALLAGLNALAVLAGLRLLAGAEPR